MDKSDVLTFLVTYFTSIVIFLTVILIFLAAFPIIFPSHPQWVLGSVDLFGLIYLVVSIIVSYGAMKLWIKRIEQKIAQL